MFLCIHVIVCTSELYSIYYRKCVAELSASENHGYSSYAPSAGDVLFMGVWYHATVPTGLSFEGDDGGLEHGNLDTTQPREDEDRSSAIDMVEF